MKRHECPSCGHCYQCPRSQCGSPLVYDCFACYVARFGRELELAADEIAERFGLNDGCNGFEFCYAH